MAAKLGAGVKSKVEHSFIEAEGRARRELVPPLAHEPPRPHLVRYDANRIGTLAGPRDELEIDGPNFLVVIEGHSRPSSCFTTGCSEFSMMRPRARNAMWSIC